MKLVFLIQTALAVHPYLSMKSYFAKHFPEQAEVNRLMKENHFSTPKTWQGELKPKVKPKQLRTNKGRRHRFAMFHMNRSDTKP